MQNRVVKLFADFEKEEKWLNEMAQEGMNFTDYVFMTYTFEKGTPGEYIFRIELLENLPSHSKSKEYIKFMEENGVECVATWFRWVYFRKKAAEGDFDIYSDTESRISHYKRIIALMGTVGVANLVIGFTNMMSWLNLSFNHGYPYYFQPGLINIVLGAGLSAFAYSYVRRINKLRKERQLYE